MMLSRLPLLSLVVYTLGTSLEKRSAEFSHGYKKTTVHSSRINEASNICASRIPRDVIYNDLGDRNRIFAFSATNGSRLASIFIDGAHALDWEDIACGPCAGGSGHCIYMADTGSSFPGWHENTIYRIHEPSSLYDRHVRLDSKLKFSWDQHDCETVMVDPRGEVYLISKVPGGHHGKLVHLPSSAWGKYRRTYVKSGVYISTSQSWYGPIGGDISPNGKEVLIKTHDNVYHWDVPDGNYYSHLQQNATAVYINERQGESVCFDPNGSGYYTLAELYNLGLYYYPRSDGETVG